MQDKHAKLYSNPLLQAVERQPTLLVVGFTSDNLLVSEPAVFHREDVTVTSKIAVT